MTLQHFSEGRLVNHGLNDLETMVSTDMPTWNYLCLRKICFMIEIHCDEMENAVTVISVIYIQLDLGNIYRLLTILCTWNENQCHVVHKVYN